ncbi:threonine aldolase family protein [Sphingobacterium spiritivorum]|uniref:threonine aldolase family protein n=1 Tax=Sphingobacterium spiritivorum TaxID=258 RepID=UPI00191B1116|nr:aminotransferase class I/II-fold pyridoxal phosphate-dependent enzyme [Sphingobacterium spiritivorum]QQS95748.1 aminotransferase class I/II-fold pyridoxal phosphate-dependent enzyme [Sphingobacterium spiritivorum]
MSSFKRRDFLKLSGLALPAITQIVPSTSFADSASKEQILKDSDAVYFINDGIFYRPDDFIAQLQVIQVKDPIERDSYATDGTMKKLLDKCIKITGKEAAIYMPSGTLANQLAISVLGKSATKAFVQEKSHVYRDEGDAAQTLFNKRLIPLATDNHWFDQKELQQAVDVHEQGEAFAVPGAVVSIETPVRRADNRVFPLEEIKKIAEYCRIKGYKMHLDGARLHVASAYTGHAIADYAQYFDTVYLCLYKYLGATGGAVLCGDKAVIDQMHHLVKIHGGGVFTNWPNAAMALHHLEDIDRVMKEVKDKSQTLFNLFNQLDGIHVEHPEHGSNISLMKIGKGIDSVKLRGHLRHEHNIILGQPRQGDGMIAVKTNATLLRRTNSQLVSAFEDAIRMAKIP